MRMLKSVILNGSCMLGSSNVVPLSLTGQSNCHGHVQAAGMQMTLCWCLWSPAQSCGSRSGLSTALRWQQAQTCPARA